MNYIQLTWKPHTGQATSFLEGFLSQHPAFNGWEETEEGALIAYIAEADFSETLQNELLEKQQEWGFDQQKQILEDQNWNALWEASYEPVEVEGFCRIRASFHQPDTRYPHEIIIDPQMSFGTGHHATTYMMVAQMQLGGWQGRTVLDYGCGTGVLAILSAMLGAKQVDAIDIDEWAYRNAVDNLGLNGQSAGHIWVAQGDLDQLPEQKQYDYILANINRNVLIKAMPELAKRLAKGGQLWISGFLAAETALLLEAACAAGLQLVRQYQREQWAWLAVEW